MPNTVIVAGLLLALLTITAGMVAVWLRLDARHLAVLRQRLLFEREVEALTRQTIDELRQVARVALEQRPNP